MTTGCGGQELGHDQNFSFVQVFISDSSAMPREDDIVTKAEAQAMVDEALLRQQLIFDIVYCLFQRDIIKEYKYINYITRPSTTGLTEE